MAPKKGTSSFGKVLLAIAWPPIALFATAGVVGLALGVFIEVFPGTREAILDGPIIQFALTALINIIALYVIVVPFFGYFFNKDTSKKEVFGLQRGPRLKDVGLVAVAFVAYFITSALLVGIAGSLLPFVNLDQAQELGIEAPRTTLELAAIFTLLVIFVPVLEELIFRGFMFKALRARLSFWPTTILVSIAFGVAHGQWNVGIDTFALSLFLCGLREYTGSLWASILLHASKNALAFTILFVFPDLIPGLQ